MPDQTPSMPPLPEPVAYKVVGGHVYIDSAFCSRDNAERSIERRNDCAVLKPLYTAEQVQAVADERVREALEPLLDGYRRIANASDSEMRDGDLAREIAAEMLKAVAPVSTLSLERKDAP